MYLLAQLIARASFLNFVHFKLKYKKKTAKLLKLSKILMKISTTAKFNSRLLYSIEWLMTTTL